MLTLPKTALKHVSSLFSSDSIFDSEARTARRLNHVYATAPIALFDDSQRIVFFSDVHRGDGSRADAFAQNKGLFLDALQYYFERDFTYVEVGDGDELWGNRSLNRIKAAHGRVFETLHRFYQARRLFLIRGNHDMPRRGPGSPTKDDMAMSEGLILRHVPTGRDLFVFHGHQADIWSDHFSLFSRFLVRNIWTQFLRSKAGQIVPLIGHTLRRAGMLRNHADQVFNQAYTDIESRIWAWAQPRRQLVLCGHTHRARMATSETCYLNTGQCVSAGSVTGIEIQDGLVFLVRWLAPEIEGQLPRRELLTTPQSLRVLFDLPQALPALVPELSMAAD